MLRQPHLRRIMSGVFATGLLIFGAAECTAEPPPPLSAQTSVLLDDSVPFSVPADTKVVSVANPAVADVAKTDAPTVYMLTGRSFGSTSVLVLDGIGNQLARVTITVGRPRGLVTVQHGPAQRTTYACGPTCSPTAAVGDSGESFGALASQLQQRGQQLTGAPQ
ncbi:MULTISPECIES: pilus assembly protein N-terminal domain-containing protein [unclassified Xanthobacter]|uniref:pilus assembly protein N-terminal domain-containing protein n=1 Tax=unclassified Xanthobacter TaxID=2623496 RepID=UPI001F30C63E|nr:MULTISPECIES: pilus assembly protein N-terminal domain-containing protein [unclassified Xanthobacter]